MTHLVILLLKTCRLQRVRSLLSITTYNRISIRRNEISMPFVVREERKDMDSRNFWVLGQWWQYSVLLLGWLHLVALLQVIMEVEVILAHWRQWSGRTRHSLASWIVLWNCYFVFVVTYKSLGLCESNMCVVKVGVIYNGIFGVFERFRFWQYCGDYPIQHDSDNPTPSYFFLGPFPCWHSSQNCFSHRRSVVRDWSCICPVRLVAQSRWTDK